MIAGILNSNEELYEAAAIDGIKNRFQEMIYITIPQMKPQMLFAAVMAIVNAFQNGLISTQLTGNPSPDMWVLAYCKPYRRLWFPSI